MRGSTTLLRLAGWASLQRGVRGDARRTRGVMICRLVECPSVGRPHCGPRSGLNSTWLKSDLGGLMESASVGGKAPAHPGHQRRPELKRGAIGYLSNLVIGVASTAPAYSLAATIGFIVVITGIG